jgi:hypothetical protein
MPPRSSVGLRPPRAEASGYKFQFPDLKSALTAIVR